MTARELIACLEAHPNHDVEVLVDPPTGLSPGWPITRVSLTVREVYIIAQPGGA